jgi:uncharacterized DUF497 family protein
VNLQLVGGAHPQKWSVAYRLFFRRLKLNSVNALHILSNIGTIPLIENDLFQSQSAKKVDKRQTWAYIYHMKYLNWNSEKNEILKRERGISFEEITYLIESDQVIGIEENPGYPNQRMYVLEIDNYAIIVPYVENDDEIFLKTAFPSRKYTKKYGLKGE